MDSRLRGNDNEAQITLFLNFATLSFAGMTNGSPEWRLFIVHNLNLILNHNLWFFVMNFKSD